MILSIVIPAYNMESYILRCLDSIYRQNVNSSLFEVVVVNDGSVDKTQLVLEEYALSKSNLKIINQKNSGVAVARNNGIAYSNGTYITFVDADDFINDNTLSIVIRKLKDLSNQSDLILLRSFLFPSGKECTSWKNHKMINNECVGSDLYEKIGLIHTVWSCLFRREFILENKLFFAEGVRNSEDTIFMTECEICAKLALIWDIPFYNYSYRENSAYNTFSENKLLSYRKGLIYSRNLMYKYDMSKDNIRSLISDNLYLYIANMTICSILSPKGSCMRMIKEFGILTYLPIDNRYKTKMKSRICLLNFSFYLYYISMAVIQKVLRRYNKWR